MVMTSKKITWEHGPHLSSASTSYSKKLAFPSTAIMEIKEREKTFLFTDAVNAVVYRFQVAKCILRCSSLARSKSRVHQQASPGPSSQRERRKKSAYMLVSPSPLPPIRTGGPGGAHNPSRPG